MSYERIVKKRLRLKDINPESYERLGAKLSYLCREQYGSDVKVKIIVAFSDRETGRGNAILWLTKHFGVFPVEISSPDGELNLRELAELALPSHLTIIIQSIPIFEGESSERDGNSIGLVGGNDKTTMIGNLKHHVPILKGLTNSLAKASVNILVQQIGVLSQWLTNNWKDINGPIIYLAGFGLLEESAHSRSLPSSKFIPWYLLLGEKNCVWRIYRQPELDTFLRKLPGDNPHIVNLESVISDMEMDPDFDCE
jgi:hypothetical protein